MPAAAAAARAPYQQQQQQQQQQKQLQQQHVQLVGLQACAPPGSFQVLTDVYKGVKVVA